MRYSPKSSARYEVAYSVLGALCCPSIRSLPVLTMYAVDLEPSRMSTDPSEPASGGEVSRYICSVGLVLAVMGKTILKWLLVEIWLLCLPYEIGIEGSSILGTMIGSSKMPLALWVYFVYVLCS